MTWLQLRIDAEPTTANQLEEALLSAGASAVTMEDNADQPLYEPAIGETPIWQHTRVTGLFEADTNVTQLLKNLNVLYGEPIPTHRVEILEDRDWIREWMDSYQPIQCGDKLWICPSWKDPVDTTATNILLDPGLAFGTGTHPTTWLCLQWLSQQNLKGLTVVDYGCGSGILGIAALLLGAAKVYAVDIDPQALSATRDNAERNGISDEKIECMFPAAFPDALQADMVLANILAGPLIELAPRIAGAAKPGAPLCLSGVLERQAPELQQCYTQWFNNIELASKEEWVRISGDRHSG